MKIWRAICQVFTIVFGLTLVSCMINLFRPDSPSSKPELIICGIFMILLITLCQLGVRKAVGIGGRFLPESRKINAGDPLPVVNAPGIILSRGEICRLAESVKIGKTKTITTRTVTYRSGGSIRIAKGLSVHSGSSSSRPIRENILDAVSGTLYVTNRRIVASSQKYNFDKPLNALSSYTMYTDGFSLQFGKESFTFLVRDRVYIMTVLLSMVDSNG